MSVVEIDSEKKSNTVETSPNFGPSTHCVVIMEQLPLQRASPPPRWRVAATLTLRDPLFGPEPVLADLPTVVVGPLIHKRQVVAMAKYAGLVSQWSFRFESDDGRAKALVWLHPGTSPMHECGIFVTHSALR
ncbi:hypothetical protein [Polyangium sp. 6x1]|uniref:hypothetical protein n=1 Tax=Polyangium sp. 6x1 TaxID=3042689 RepID=UPI0024825F3E|nr:hypothetical protein [Polyangium sp. 6x1]MDI1450775.1 hypothetical protein [Polyangium sp. 6x1]